MLWGQNMSDCLFTEPFELETYLHVSHYHSFCWLKNLNFGAVGGELRQCVCIQYTVLHIPQLCALVYTRPTALIIPGYSQQ